MRLAGIRFRKNSGSELPVQERIGYFFVMNRKKFLAFVSGISLLSSKSFSGSYRSGKYKMEMNFIRHATFLLKAGGQTFLIDPMLGVKDSMDPVPNCSHVARIPMVELPFPENSLRRMLTRIDAVIVTHTHRDHWDVAAQELLDKKIPLICQPSDKEKLAGQGFTNLISIENSVDFRGLKISRTGGQHGRGEIGLRMGTVSGFVIGDGNKKIYIAGDTIWCPEVEQAVGKHVPDVIVLNAGAAQFDQGDPITMTAADVIKTIEASPSAKIIAVHMETVNHCRLKRPDLRKALEEKDFGGRYIIPEDGDQIVL